MLHAHATGYRKFFLYTEIHEKASFEIEHIYEKNPNSFRMDATIRTHSALCEYRIIYQYIQTMLCSVYIHEYSLPSAVLYCTVLYCSELNCAMLCCAVLWLSYAIWLTWPDLVSLFAHFPPKSCIQYTIDSHTFGPITDSTHCKWRFFLSPVSHSVRNAIHT